MNQHNLRQLGFDRVWCVDFEFHAPDGHNPQPICMVAREALSGDLIRVWYPQLRQMRECPFPTDTRTLVVAFFAAAEMSCFMALGWEKPERILDLYFEYRALTNGREYGGALIKVLPQYGVPAMDGAEKDTWRDDCISGRALKSGYRHRAGLLDYCQTDVDVLVDLLDRMAPEIFDPATRARRTHSRLELYTREQLAGQALFRGRYSWALAAVERNGVPVDQELLNHAIDNWDGLQHFLIDQLESEHGIHVYKDYSFSSALFARFLVDRDIAWPRTPSGQLSLSDNTFKDLEKRHPEVAPIRALRNDVGQLKLRGFTLGNDGRNRTGLGPFRSKTGRNQPSNAKCLFMAGAWLRSFITPEPGRALAYIDWSSQEAAIAAALADDKLLMHAYKSGDVYMGFLIDAGMVPEGATKDEYPELRAAAKACVLGNQYGMGAALMGERMGKSEWEAQQLIKAHKRTYWRYWQWTEKMADTFYAGVSLGTALGWQLHPSAGHRPTSIMNWQTQSHGADMLRLALCELVEAGIQVALPVHDAVIIEADEAHIDKVVHRARKIMERASRKVLHGKITVGTDVKVFRHGERFVDEGRGVMMWDMVMRFLDREDECFVRDSPTSLGDSGAA